MELVAYGNLGLQTLAGQPELVTVVRRNANPGLQQPREWLRRKPSDLKQSAIYLAVSTESGGRCPSTAGYSH